MTNEKTIALTRWIFVGKVVSLVLDVDNLISGSSAFSKTSEHLKVHSSRIAEAWLGEF